jgi:hypothetical protein
MTYPCVNPPKVASQKSLLEGSATPQGQSSDARVRSPPYSRTLCYCHANSGKSPTVRLTLSPEPSDLPR